MDVIQRSHEYLFSSKVLYYANDVSRDLDNIDQRICADVESAIAGGTGSHGLVKLVKQLVSSFTYLGLAVDELRSTDAVVVLPIVLAAFVLGQVTVLAASTYIPPRVAEAAKREGDFRRVHTNVREFSEQIAFFGGERAELRAAEAAWRRLFDARRRLNLATALARAVALFWAIGTPNLVEMGLSVWMEEQIDGGREGRPFSASEYRALQTSIHSITAVLVALSMSVIAAFRIKGSLARVSR